jgi:ferric-dicitrate binding protein FerR (iron transport regulator)
MLEMTRERFAGLAEAYGGEIARWPQDEREAAAALVAADPDFTRPTLAAASDLDEALAQWPAPPMRAALRETVLAAAPRPRRPAWAARVALGAGLAGACASGLAVGALFLGAMTESNGAAVTAAMTGFEAAGLEAASPASDV